MDIVIWSTEWPRLAVVYLENALLYIWVWIGQPSILLSSVLYFRHRRNAVSMTIVAGCVGHALGRFIAWYAMKVAPHETTPQGYDVFSGTTLFHAGYAVWWLGNLLIAGGALLSALDLLKQKALKAQPAAPPYSEPAARSPQG